MSESTNVNTSAIDRLRARHTAALNDGDADAWAACFAADGVQMPPNFAANVGMAAIQGWGRGFLGQFDCRFELSVDEVRAAGEWAFERGGYTIHLTPKDGGPAMDDVGKYLTVYERQPDGEWRIARDIWNSDQPLPMP